MRRHNDWQNCHARVLIEWFTLKFMQAKFQCCTMFIFAGLIVTVNLTFKEQLHLGKQDVHGFVVLDVDQSSLFSEHAGNL